MKRTTFSGEASVSTKFIFSLLISFFILTAVHSVENTDPFADLMTDNTSDKEIKSQEITEKYFNPAGYFKNTETNVYFKFDGDEVISSKVPDRSYKCDVTGDNLTIGGMNLTAKIEDAETFSTQDILYSGRYIRLDVYDTALLESDLTSDLNAGIFILTQALNSGDGSKKGIAKIFGARGSKYYQLKQYDLSIEDFNKAVENDPDVPQYYLGRAYSYIYKGDNGNAYDDIDEAIKSDPDNADEFLYFTRGGLNYIKGDDTGAVSDLGKSVEKSPSFTEAYNYRGNAYTRLGKIELAIKDFTKVIELDPSSKQAYIDRGKAYGKAGDYVNAFADFDKGGYIPEESYGFVAGYYFGKADFTNAKKFCDLAISARPADPEPYLYRGFMLFASGDYQKSMNDYDKALDLKKDFYLAYKYRGVLQFVQNQYQAAINDFNRAIELNREDADPFILRLACSLFTGKKEADKYLSISEDAAMSMKDSWQKSLLDFFTDNIDTTALLYITMSEKTNLPDRLSSAYFYIALKNQIKGLNSNAKTSYRISIDAGAKLNFTYYLSASRIKKLK
jgi:tetratricopeptide (TPR) repeat protein